MNFAVAIVSPPKYAHSEAFAEIAETLHQGLLGLGHDSILTRKLACEPDRRVIVLGSNMLSALRAEPPANSVLYNLEQVQAGSSWMKPGLLELFRRYPVWDYSQQNIERLVSMGLPRPTLLPIGYTKELTRIVPAPQEDIDVLFYGCLNERRTRVLQALRARGLAVKALFSVYGAQRDAVIARARIVLNVHYYEAKVFEAVRVSYLLANRRAVVSERGAAPEEEADFERGVSFASYDELVERCVQLVHHPVERQRLGEAGFELMSARSEQDYLRAALGPAKESAA